VGQGSHGSGVQVGLPVELLKRRVGQRRELLGVEGVSYVLISSVLLVYCYAGTFPIIIPAAYFLSGIGLVSVIFGFLFHAPWRQNIRPDRWRWAAIFIGCLVVIYLPGYGGERRYYFSVYPFLLGGSLGFVGYLAKSRSGQEKILHIMALSLVSLSFLFFLANKPFFPERPSYQAAKILKEKLNALHISGPIASTSGLENIDSYTAFLMQVPWHGRSKRSQTVEEVESSLAKIIIVDRGTLADENLHNDTSFISLDEKMFDSLGRDFDPGVKVYINSKI